MMMMMMNSGLAKLQYTVYQKMTKIYSVFTCLHTKKDLSSLIAFEEKLENYLLYDVLCGVFKLFCIGFQWHEYSKIAAGERIKLSRLFIVEWPWCISGICGKIIYWHRSKKKDLT